MNQSPQTWQWQEHAPVRADAEGMFVPCSALPDAGVGDIVVVNGDAGGEQRTGTITALSEGDDETFFRVALRPAGPPRSRSST
ncbi:MAG: hypothetical protein JJD93_02560 [Ilumatobacteraceae bacterium]|nr:hypothetical protein [Ilumatobacteraceae bacterium]